MTIKDRLYCWGLVALAFVIALCIVLFAPPPSAKGEGCGYSYRSYRSYVAKKVVQDVVFTRFVAVIPLADLPTYSAVYTPPVVAPVVPGPAPGPVVPGPVPGHGGLQAPKAGQAPAAQPDALQTILAKLEAMEARINKLEGKPLQASPGPKEPKEGPKGPPGALGVMANKCAVCHEARTAADKGGSFVLFNGTELAPLGVGQQAKVMKRVTLEPSDPKRMPPKESGHVLTEEEINAVVNHMLQLK